MKRVLQFKALNFLLLFVLLFSSKSVQGQVIVDDFNYVSGSTLISNGWIATSGTGTNNLIVNSTGLSFAGSPSSNIGFDVSLASNGEDAVKTFSAISTGTIYTSFFVNVSAAQTGGDYFAGLSTGSTTFAFPYRIYIKSTTGGFLFGCAKSGAGATIVYDTTVRSFGTTYLVAGSYTYNTSSTTDDVANLWINPVLGTSEVAPVITNATGVDAAAAGITAFLIRQGSASSSPLLEIDGIRVGASWSSITPSAAPSITGAATTAVFNTTFGTASAAQQFPVSGSNLTADLIATAPTGFEVSSDGTNYNSTATFTQTAGAASGTLYIRLSANAAVGNTIYDNQNIVLSSTGATSVNITTPASGNSVANAALQNQTISFNVLMFEPFLENTEIGIS